MALGHSDFMPHTHRRSVGVFSTRQAAEQALHELRDSNFPMQRVSIIARDADRANDIAANTGINDRVDKDNQADKGAAVGAASGGALGGLTGLLVGLGTLAIPGIGPIMLAGAAATALATTIAGGAIGAVAGGLIGALVGLGIPEDRARVYNDRVSRGHFLVIVDGTDEELARAEAILRNRGIEEYGVYDAHDTVDTANRPGMGHMTDVPPGVAPVAGMPHTETPMIRQTVGSERQHKRAIGIFRDRQRAESALLELKNSGFPIEHVSIIGKDTDNISHINDRVAGINTGNKADEGAKTGAASGAALGGLGGLLVGLGTLAIPGVGPVILGGAAATALATAVSGGAIGAAAGGIAGGLVGMGIPEDQARMYNDRLNRGDYLVIIDGTMDEVRRAETILNRQGIQDWEIFDAHETVHHNDRIDRTGRHDATPLL